jgi:4-amino-4-deoxy-L-arabinose transferase-like glycosyltransferase
MNSIRAEDPGIVRVRAPTTARLSGIFAWCVAFSIAALVIVLVGFTSQDPDSNSYATISAHLSALAIRDWIAPQWWQVLGFDGPFREHPVGVFLLPALIGKLGVPPLQAGFVVGLAFSIAALLLLQRVTALIVGEREAAVVSWVALILPVAFINRIRATQEYPMLVFTLLALYATQKARDSAAWIPVSILAACAVALMKGVFVVFVPIVCGLWLISMRKDTSGDIRAWVGIGLSLAAVAVLAIVYEDAYRRVAGESFLDYYLPYRLGQISAGDQTPGSFIALKLGNLGWYVARLLWFGFPGTLALLVAAATRKGTDHRPATRLEMQGLLFALAAAAAYVVVMSFGTTRAERFILPAYFSVGIAGAFVAIRRWGAVARLADKLETLTPQAVPLAWLVLVLAALPFELYVPYVKFRP